MTTGIDESAKLPFWQWDSDGMSIRWVQRLPDQSRAFFAARQFSKDDAERIANSCVFQTVYKNTAAADARMVIEYDMATWRVLPRGKSPSKPHSPKLKKRWLAEWKQRNVTTAARIAFEWSLLPTRHRLLSGDYNWGMTTFGLQPGERFDLEIHWRKDGKPMTALVRDIECAKDLHMDPASPAFE